MSCRKARRSRPNRKGSEFESLPLVRQGGLATGKIDGSLQPSSSLVVTRAFQAPAYVNSDCGTRAMAFDRIQVNALVRMVTAAAGTVTGSPFLSLTPGSSYNSILQGSRDLCPAFLRFGFSVGGGS